jgi:dihydrofolate reductase / thymidylate synthase
MKPFAIVVAFDAHYGIGKNGQLPWRLPLDLKRFKDITSAVVNPKKKNAVIMGRKTWESLPLKFRPLPDRLNVVLSREGKLNLPEAVLKFSSLDDALKDLANSKDIENIFVIGGAQIYAEATIHPLCQKIYVTHVQGEFSCDAFFPPLSKDFFPIHVSETYHEGNMAFHFSDYLRY